MKHGIPFAVFVLATFSCGGGGGNHSTPEERDVSGNYALRYDDQLKVRLDVGGAVREVTQTGYGGVVDFGVINGQPTTLDLTAFCAKPEVRCPSEAFWAKVAVTQPDLQTSNLELQKLVVVNDTQHVLDAGVRAESLSGLVNHADDDRFLLGLGAQGGASGSCAAIAVSLAGGRFSRVGEHEETSMEPRTLAGRVCSLDAGVSDAGLSADGGQLDAGLLPDGGLDCTLVPIKRLVSPPGAKVDGIKEGKVFLGWAGGCAFGPVLAGATLTFETGFTGARSGAYDPPPFTPAPVVLPDGGLDAGVSEVLLGAHADVLPGRWGHGVLVPRGTAASTPAPDPPPAAVTSTAGASTPTAAPQDQPVPQPMPTPVQPIPANP